MGQPTEHYLWQHITDMKWKFWWKSVRWIGLPGDPCISSKSSPPRVSLVCFSSASPFTPLLTVWLECFLCLVFFLPLPSLPCQMWMSMVLSLNPDSGVTERLCNLALLAFWAFPEQGRHTRGFISSSLQGLDSVLLCDRPGVESEEIGWVVVTHVHPELYPCPRGCCAVCVNQSLRWTHPFGWSLDIWRVLPSSCSSWGAGLCHSAFPSLAGDVLR